MKNVECNELIILSILFIEFNIIKKKGPSLSFSLKLIVWTSYLTGTTIYIGYSATVVSFMATRNLVPIRTAEELKSSSLPIYGDGDNIGNPYVYEVSQSYEIYRI